MPYVIHFNMSYSGIKYINYSEASGIRAAKMSLSSLIIDNTIPVIKIWLVWLAMYSFWIDSFFIFKEYLLIMLDIIFIIDY